MDFPTGTVAMVGAPLYFYFLSLRVVKGGVHQIPARALTTTLPVRPPAAPPPGVSERSRAGSLGMGRKTGKQLPCRRGQLPGACRAGGIKYWEK